MEFLYFLRNKGSELFLWVSGINNCNVEKEVKGLMKILHGKKGSIKERIAYKSFP